MRFLLAGGGSIGKRHIKNLQQLGERDIWVLKRMQDNAFEKEFNVNVVTSFEEASNLGFDAIFVCTPTSLHNEGLQFGIENRLHIFMEKPLIHKEDELEKAITLMKNYNKVFFIGFMLRYHPLVQKIKSIITSGVVGSTFSGRFEFGSYLPYWHPGEDYRISYAARKELGGGVINTITHELDLIQYIFGYPQSLFCEARNLDRLHIDVEETADAIFNYPDKTVTLHLDYLQKDYDRKIVILGDEGKIVWNWHENSMKVHLHKSGTEVFEIDSSFEVNQLYVDEIKDFLQLVESEKKKHELDFNHAYKNTQLMLKMHESALTGRKIQG